jgi:hypothetical protein
MLIYTVCGSLEHATIHLSVMSLHRLLLGNCFKAVDPQSCVFTSLLADDGLTTKLPGWRPSHTNLLLF